MVFSAENWCRRCREYKAREEDGMICPVCRDKSRVENALRYAREKLPGDG